MLLDADADPNRTKPTATTLLQRAIQYRDIEIIMRLIHHGADVIKERVTELLHLH